MEFLLFSTPGFLPSAVSVLKHCQVCACPGIEVLGGTFPSGFGSAQYKDYGCSELLSQQLLLAFDSFKKQINRFLDFQGKRHLWAARRVSGDSLVTS